MTIPRVAGLASPLFGMAIDPLPKRVGAAILAVAGVMMTLTNLSMVWLTNHSWTLYVILFFVGVALQLEGKSNGRFRELRLIPEHSKEHLKFVGAVVWPRVADIVPPTVSRQFAHSQSK